MKKVTDNEIIDNLSKWKSICNLMGSKRDVTIVNHIIKKLTESNNEETKNNKINNKETPIDKLKHILDAINKKDQAILNKYKFCLLYTS